MKKIITELSQLSKPCEKVSLADEHGVTLNEAKEIVKEITEVMEANKDISALSAPQIGINKRVICIRFSDGIKAFINPIYRKKIGERISLETCASMPGKEIAIIRPTEIEVSYYNNEVKPEDNKYLDVAAAVFEQQYFILDGILPGFGYNILSSEKEVSYDDIPVIVAAESTGDGVIIDTSKEDHLTNEELPQIADILTKYRNTFSMIVDNIVNSNSESDEAKLCKYLRTTDKVISGEIKILENPFDENNKKNHVKLNRPQRRAMKKQIRQLAKKKAGK